jgi:hypothetical protein
MGPFSATQVKSQKIVEESCIIEEADIPSSHELLGRPAVHDLMKRLKQETQKKTDKFQLNPACITARQEDRIWHGASKGG